MGRIIRSIDGGANKKMPPGGRRHYQFKGRAYLSRYKEREAQTLPCICSILLLQLACQLWIYWF